MSSSANSAAEAMRAYDRLGERFDELANPYDTATRVNILFDVLLGDTDLRGKRLLDAGCGTGPFSCRAIQRGAHVVSFDIGPQLLTVVRKKCAATLVAGSILALPFADGTFDVVVSSEVIEHVPRPTDAVREFARVLRPGGLLALSTPNWVWKWSVLLAGWLRVRPFHGLENWLGYRQLRRCVTAAGLTVLQQRGIHLLPFQLRPLQAILPWFDRNARWLYPVMINQAILARKPDVAVVSAINRMDT